MSYGQKAIVVHEKRELDHKLDLLIKFTENHDFIKLDHGVQTMLLEQRQVMKRYSEILARRIQWFDRAAR